MIWNYKEKSNKNLFKINRDHPNLSSNSNIKNNNHFNNNNRNKSNKICKIENRKWMHILILLLTRQIFQKNLKIFLT